MSLVCVFFIFLLTCAQDDEPDYHESRRSARRRFDEELEVEAHAEKRMINAKRVLLWITELYAPSFEVHHLCFNFCIYSVSGTEGYSSQSTIRSYAAIST